MTNAYLDLSICIVNHRTPELTNQCLRSIANTIGDISLEVLVANNTQDKFIAEPLRYGLGQVAVHYIQNEKPLGFAANQTRMMQIASGQYFMALNSDTVIQPGALQELLQFVKSHAQCGLVGPRVVHPDGTLQATCRNFPSPIVHFLEASGIWRRLGNSRWMARRLYLVHPHDAVLSPDWLTGVCMLISAEVFRKVGGMNADLSPEMFAEDLEWCWRIRKAGYEIMFDPAATIVHHESASPLDNRAVKTYKSFYRFCASHYSKTFCAGIRLATIMALAPKFLLSRDLEKRTIYAAIMKLPVI